MQTSCFNFMIPKLALEIIESPGHYHEVMINTETMPPSFWNWFLIGYKRARKMRINGIAYTRVYSKVKRNVGRIRKEKMRNFLKTEVRTGRDYDEYKKENYGNICNQYYGIFCITIRIGSNSGTCK